MPLLIAKASKQQIKLKTKALMGEKKVKGRKRYISTDTLGHLLHVRVHAANMHDTVGGCPVFEKTVEKYPTIEGVCADAGYRKTMEEFVRNVCNKTIEISERISEKWTILPKSWVVERTFSWLNGYRGLAKDFEISISSAENYVMIPHSMLPLNRLAKSLI